MGPVAVRSPQLETRATAPTTHTEYSTCFTNFTRILLLRVSAARTGGKGARGSWLPGHTIKREMRQPRGDSFPNDIVHRWLVLNDLQRIGGVGDPSRIRE